MGSCMSGDKNQPGKEYFHKDLNLKPKFQVYQPLFSTLFNAMRKQHSEFDIITNSVSQSKKTAHNNNAVFPSSVSIDDVANMPTKSVKMLYSFKKILILGEYEKIKDQISSINSNASISATYVLTNKEFQRFQKEFPIYKRFPLSVSTSQVPVLAFRSEELLHPPSKPIYIYIHLAQERNDQIYKQLGIETKGIIPECPSDDFMKQQEYYVEKLKGCQKEKILLLHNRSVKQDSIMKILSKYVVNLFDLGEFSTKQYLVRSLPQAHVLGHSEQFIGGVTSEKQVPLKMQANTTGKSSKTDKHFESMLQTFQRLLKSHCSEMGKERTERAYNLLSKLLSNILGNSNEEQYRKVKGANKQMEELLTRSKSGIKLLEELGFKESGGYWVNGLELKYLKVLRTDLDLGYKNYLTKST